MCHKHVVCLSKWNQLENISQLQAESLEGSEPNISFVVLCKNEERCIERCIQSIQCEYACEDEIIVIDTGSTDNSVQIINQIQECRLIETEWQDDFSVIRNIGIQQASHSWIFFIDADEWLEKNSIQYLKKFLKVLDYHNIHDVIISPLIINSNLHMIREVKRIFRKEDGITYFGCIHEEPRKDIEKLGADLIHLFMDNVILHHDGYQRDIVRLKDKGKRNEDLLKKMISIEPDYPRWKYFFCKDMRGSLDKAEYEQLLNEVIHLSNQRPQFLGYQMRAMSDLIRECIDAVRFNEAVVLIDELEKLNKDLSDIVYYRHLIQYVKCKMEILQMIQSLSEYTEQSGGIEYGGIHSGYFHIEHLLGRLYFDLGDYEHAFEIFHQLDANEFIDISKVHQKLNEQVMKSVEMGHLV